MAGGRKEARQWALQMLYQLDINPAEMTELFDDFFEEKKYANRDRAFAEKTVRGVLKNVEAIDKKVEEFTPKWDMDRLGGVDRNVLRIAAYEMIYCDDIPPVVSINEAVQNAKDYSGMESGKFVNGVLDELRKTLDRPARSTYKSAEERIKERGD
ncbi:transcription antitermination factor NusB [Verrucomicrobiota bacterium]